MAGSLKRLHFIFHTISLFFPSFYLTYFQTFLNSPSSSFSSLQLYYIQNFILFTLTIPPLSQTFFSILLIFYNFSIFLLYLIYSNFLSTLSYSSSHQTFFIISFTFSYLIPLFISFFSLYITTIIFYFSISSLSILFNTNFSSTTPLPYFIILSSTSFPKYLILFSSISY
jgi:hypothetical protein